MAEQLLLHVWKADELHVGVADGAAGERSVVLEEEHGLIAAAFSELLPHAEPEADERVHVLLRVGGHVALAFAPLDEHELVGALDDIVFVAQEDHVAFRCDDIRQVRAVAERAGLLAVAYRFGFMAGCADVEAHEIDVHAAFLSIFVKKLLD